MTEKQPTRSFHEAAKRWIVLCDENNQASDTAREAEKVRSGCAKALLEQENKMLEFVGRNVPEKVAVVGDSVVIAHIDDGIRRRKTST